MRRLFAVAALGAALAFTASATAVPPITCGPVKLNGKRYVVKSHISSCTFAIRGVKAFVAHRTSPALFKCKRYGADIPAYCIGTGKYKKRYFFAGKP
jgi:hypothetical protein